MNQEPQVHPDNAVKPDPKDPLDPPDQLDQQETEVKLDNVVNPDPLDLLDQLERGANLEHVVNLEPLVLPDPPVSVVKPGLPVPQGPRDLKAHRYVQCIFGLNDIHLLKSS